MASTKRKPQQANGQPQALLKRQQEVLLLICDGLTTQEIAERLGIAKKTVEFHRTKLMKSLGVRNAALLVREAIRLGIVKA